MWNIHLAAAKKHADNLQEEVMKGWTEKLVQAGCPPPHQLAILQLLLRERRFIAADLKLKRLIISSLFESIEVELKPLKMKQSTEIDMLTPYVLFGTPKGTDPEPLISILTFLERLSNEYSFIDKLDGQIICSLCGRELS